MGGTGTRVLIAGARSEIITQYAPMRAVLSLAEHAARSETAVVITGEPGTGKGLLARWLHQRSHRSGGPLVTVDCAELPDDVLESELFGQELGARTGAPDGAAGLVDLATGGTLFLQAIDALHPRLQGKLLHAPELGALRRPDGAQQRLNGVRVVAASERDLERCVAEGTFRGDLYYRINAISITLPPLRERVVDIPLLAQHFLERSGGASAPVLSPEAVDALQAHPWPANVRELRMVIERAALVAADGVVRPSDLLLPGRCTGAPLIPLDGVEREHIHAVLCSVGWHQGRAAEILGISPKTLYRKIRRYGFRRPNGS
jgi:DNA-binding NtrC family response regulator